MCVFHNVRFFFIQFILCSYHFRLRDKSVKKNYGLHLDYYSQLVNFIRSYCVMVIRDADSDKNYNKIIFQLSCLLLKPSPVAFMAEKKKLYFCYNQCFLLCHFLKYVFDILKKFYSGIKP